MRIEKDCKPTFYLPLCAPELAALISSTRSVVEGAKDELDTDEVCHLRRVLADFDKRQVKSKELVGVK